MAGAPNGKYVLTTKPVSAMTFGGQLEYYLSCFGAPSNATPAGILNTPFQDLYKTHKGRPSEKLLDDGQHAAAALWYACWGIRDALNAAVGGAGVAVDYSSVNGGNRKAALDAMQRLFVNHLSNASKRTTLKNMLRNTAPTSGAFDNQGKLLAPTIDATQPYYMQTDALDLLFSAIGDAMHEQNRWIVGRALHTSLPGFTLDLEIGSFTRPYTH